MVSLQEGKKSDVRSVQFQAGNRRLIVEKGDSSITPDKRCTYCISFGLECTHNTPMKKRGPKNSLGCVSFLVNPPRVEEDVLTRPHISVTNLEQFTLSPSHPSSPETPSHLTSFYSSAPTSPAKDGDMCHVGITEQLKKVAQSGMHGHFGPSSYLALIESARGLKQEIIGRGVLTDHQHYRRPYYWQRPSWEGEIETDGNGPPYTFPDNTLLVSLISLYFERFNSHFPTLHEPTFRKNVVHELHHTDRQFGAVLLAVCALGAKFWDDERVLSVPGHTLSAGWKWFEQIQSIHRSFLDTPSLYELQYYCVESRVVPLLAIFDLVNLAGGGLPPRDVHPDFCVDRDLYRRAVEMGAHRRMPEGYKPTVDDEQTKRTFWVLVVLDVLVCNNIGRPTAIRDEDFDLELPAECDDEYWENANRQHLAFKQPSGRPSYVSGFIATIRLSEILAFVLRSLFSLKRSKFGVMQSAEPWERNVVAELDSALNHWKSKLPEHLQWNPGGVGRLFFEQSAFVHALFYVVQIQAHRRFAQSSPKSFASLAICTNATRSCLNVLDALVQKNVAVMPQLVFLGFTAGILLLSQVWASKRAGLPNDCKRVPTELEKLLRFLRYCEDRWLVAGKFGDVVYELSRGLEVDHGAPQSHCSPNSSVSSENHTPVDDDLDLSIGSVFFPVVKDPAESQSAQSPRLSENGDYFLLETPRKCVQTDTWRSGLGPSSMEFEEGDGEGLLDINMWNMPEFANLGIQYEDWKTSADSMTLDLNEFMKPSLDFFGDPT
ncbi:Gypsy retrotransposon integrase-like protein 1 [Marasmius crinis-equi]|uniref:Gypsy retrotransposon integrase-like protein 1 n=1 Tax=Marasmius crinis-equi TaxID=585013 RepID=A0ABR3FJW7_9AGAR